MMSDGGSDFTSHDFKTTCDEVGSWIRAYRRWGHVAGWGREKLSGGSWACWVPSVAVASRCMCKGIWARNLAVRELTVCEVSA